MERIILIVPNKSSGTKHFELKLEIYAKGRVSVDCVCVSATNKQKS